MLLKTINVTVNVVVAVTVASVAALFALMAWHLLSLGVAAVMQLFQG